MKRLSRLFETTWLIPLLYLGMNYRAVLGRLLFYHDSRDGIAAFKFALSSSSLIPPYWNWLDAAGMPFWLDMGWFRVQDPLMWVPMVLLKSLPLSIEHKFNLFMFFRIFVFGIGLGLLFRTLGFSSLVRNACVAMLLFGGLGHVFFPSVGMLDTAFGITFLIYFSIRFFETSRARYALLGSLFFIHATLSYHLLYIGPMMGVILLSWLGIHRDSARRLWETLWSEKAALLLVLIICASSLASVMIATKQHGLIPILRNIPFNSRVTPEGMSVTPGLQYGNSVLDLKNMTHQSAECGTEFYCAELSFTDLSSLFVYKNVWETNSFITLFGVLCALASLFLVRTKTLAVTVIATVFATICGLGHHTPLYNVIQKLLPYPNWVRHTEFFMPFIAIGLVAMAGQFLMAFDFARIKRWLPALLAGYLGAVAWQVSSTDAGGIKPWAVYAVLAITATLLIHRKKFVVMPLVLVLLEGTLFYTKIAQHYRFVAVPEKSIITEALPQEFYTRAYRVSNQNYGPRWFHGIVSGQATALEGGEDFAETDNDMLNFLHIPSFSLSDYLSARLHYSGNLTALKRVFGVTPYPAFQWFPESALAAASAERERNIVKVNDGLLLVEGISPKESSSSHEAQGMPSIKIEGDRLSIDVSSVPKGIAYLSVPHQAVAKVQADGKDLPFFKAQNFGVAFALSGNTQAIQVIPDSSASRWVYLLFYGSYLLGGGGLVVVYLSERTRSARKLKIQRPVLA